MNARKLDADLRRVLRSHGVTPNLSRIRVEKNKNCFPEFEYDHYDIYWDSEATAKKRKNTKGKQMCEVQS